MFDPEGGGEGLVVFKITDQAKGYVIFTIEFKGLTLTASYSSTGAKVGGRL